MPIALTPDQLAVAAAIRDWAIGLARTDPDVPKHQGIIYFLIDMHPAIRKLIGTAHRQAVAETVLELLGPASAGETDASGEFLLTRCLSIAGGTTQILLNQVGERVLGLPR